MELIIKGILILDIHNKEIRIVKITITIHPPHHPATHTDWVGGGQRDKIPQGTTKHEEQEQTKPNNKTKRN